jgi:membrane protease YdiL (CAAX protease family)
MALGWQVSSYFLAGGLSGVAEDIEVDYPTLLASLLQNTLIPFIGVGLFLRRDWRATFQRLGLGPISLPGFGISLVLVFGLLMMVVIFSGLWAGIVSEETFEEQTEASSALAESVNTVGLAFALAMTAAVGEEIAFRGALQPVFGFWVTAFVFAFSHVQYTLTPAALLIFFVAIALGWVRRRFNTTTAILVHFLYNFIPLLLVVAFPEESASGFLRLLF